MLYMHEMHIYERGCFLEAEYVQAMTWTLSRWNTSDMKLEPQINLCKHEAWNIMFCIQHNSGVLAAWGFLPFIFSSGIKSSKPWTKQISSE